MESNKAIEEIISQTTEEYMLDRLSLSDCRITQHEDRHIEKWNGSMYAYDISCVKWRSFDVFAPQNNHYTVRLVSSDARLWNYIILQSWETWYLFAHVTTWLKRGDNVWPWDRIWEVDKSWLSQNYHLHYEIWKNDYNISIKNYLEGNIVYNMEHSYQVRKQRGWYIWEAEAMDFIADFEWFRKCAYVDGKNWDGSTRWSIWYGTLSFPWECISQEEAKNRKIWHVEMVYEYIYKNVFLENHNQRKAMASALYNLWIGSSIQNIQGMTPEQIKNYFLKYTHSDICKTKSNPKWVCRWLEKRRNIEINKFNSLN